MTPSKRILSIFNLLNIEPLELFLAITTTLWGFFLLLPFNTFSTSGSFNILGSIAPEFGWGMFVFIGGLLHVISISRNDIYWRRDLNMILYLVWLFFAINFIQANPYGTGTIIYPMIFIGKAWVYLRISQQIRLLDEI